MLVTHCVVTWWEQFDRHMKDKIKIAGFLMVMVLTSCAHYSTTQQNIKKVNDAFEIKKTKDIAAPTQSLVSPPTADESTGAIPLSQFLDSKAPTVIQSINPWYSKLKDWSQMYVQIAEDESDVRNYKLSEKYSAQAVVWAHRAKQIKDLPTSGAVVKVSLWLDQLLWPNLPTASAYYLAIDAYQKIYTTKNILQGFNNRFCLLNNGVDIIRAKAYLDLSIDLYNQKKYAKSLYKIQNGLASVENVTPKDDTQCGSSSEDETDEQSSK